MRIKEITDDKILFNNGNEITYDHRQECCEWNFADFKAIDEPAIYNVDFDENLKFEAVQDAGFRFGSHPLRMFFVPCYSYQNGYYSSDIEIYYNGKQVLNFYCDERIE